MTQSNAGSAILGMCWQQEACGILVACDDKSVKRFDPQSNQMVPVAQHDAPIKDVASVIVPTNNQSLVITGGWDAKVKFWIWQGPQQLQQIADVYVAMPVHYMSCTWPLLVTAH